MAADASRPPQSLERLDNGRPRFHGCSRIQDYEYICKLGEGTFGEVSKAKSKKNGHLVALKKILMHNEKDGFPITALREIKLLKQLDHVNILKLEEMAVERPKKAQQKTSMFMVTPYMDHDLSGLLENPSVHFTEPQIKCYMKQLLQGCAYLHENKILHRDMKAANLLISNKGILQIADFGLARPYDDEPPKPGQGGGEATREYTTLVVTRWYRPPELLLQLRRYTTAIDMWGVGCVFGEMFKGKPILAGNSDLNQAVMIFELVGSPTDQNMPGWRDLPGVEGHVVFEEKPSTLRRQFKDQSDLAISLLSELLKLDWRKRINAIDALEHPYFHTPPLPALPGDLPTFEESHELDRRKFRDQKNKPPPAPAGGSVGIQAQGEWGINGRPLPPDARAPPPRYQGGRPYQNGGHGQTHNRRPYQDRNGGRDADFRPPPRNYPTQDRRPPYDGPRVPPNGPPPDDYYSRRPQPDTSLPARPPPPSEMEPLEGYRGPPPYRERDRDRDDRGPPPRSRLPPSTDLDRRPPRDAGGRGGGGIDTFIPSYSNADHEPRSRRPPPPRDDRDRDYDRPPPSRRPDGRRGSADFSDRMYDDGPPPPPPRYQAGRRGSRDYDDPPLRYDERPAPPRRASAEYNYDDRPHSRESRGRAIDAGPPMYDNRRRSRSPRDWSRDRGGGGAGIRDRGGGYDMRRDDTRRDEARRDEAFYRR